MKKRIFIDNDKQGIYLYEKNGDFKNHSEIDLLIAEVHDEYYGKMICDLLNENCK
ncbi:hypothetical protein [Paenibacillus pini]|uniref:Uncharacterized protein n=1 Tax=Paenibacillus pini JCM 16418 TaxID=1236976 RepID=W7Z1L9_9BACL|nr:hypothetical protein [Paenibacillus pini]GAF10881.1 hypothetical protein JCM16418_5112 [Paenibacillus pini JCM 16418]